MTVEFAGHYRPTTLLVVDLVAEICERAKSDLETLGLDPLPVAVIHEKTVAIRSAITASGSDETFHLDAGLLATVRSGCFLYLDKLAKVKKAQLKLGIEAPDDTDAAIAHAQELADAADVQLSIGLVR